MATSQRLAVSCSLARAGRFQRARDGTAWAQPFICGLRVHRDGALALIAPLGCLKEELRPENLYPFSGARASGQATSHRFRVSPAQPCRASYQ